MAKIIFSRIGWFFLLLLIQIFIFNHIHIAGVATSFAYIYLLLILPSNTPKALYVGLGFIMGLLVDIFNNTPGVSAAATTAVGLFSPYLFSLFHSKEEDEDTIVIPSVRSLGWAKFSYYAFTLCLIQCLLFYLIENFSFSMHLILLSEILSSTFFTFVIILLFEWVRNSNRH